MFAGYKLESYRRMHVWMSDKLYTIPMKLLVQRLSRRLSLLDVVF
jgi:hypothetical protein